MKFNFVKVTLAAATLLSVSIVNTAFAGLIEGTLNTDDQHWVYVSTDNNVQGTLLSHVYGWQTTDSFSSALTAGTDYFLHVRVKNDSSYAGFIGDFSLDGSQHLFSNGLNTTVTNTTDWQVSSSGWTNYGSATSQGANGVSPWHGFSSGVDSNAHWIWDSSVAAGETNYFTIAIKAVDVPEPSSIALLGLALLGFSARRLQNK